MPNINAIERFARVPDIEKPRSIFTQETTTKTSGNIADVIPIYCNFLYPGTTMKMNISEVIRLQTLLTPIMDNVFCDIHAWAVPMRLTWTHTKEFFGENSSSAWIPQVTYQVPSISSPLDSNNDPTYFETGTLADYFGLPAGEYTDPSDNSKFSVTWTNSDPRRPMALPFRAYALICNEFFRSESLTDPLNIPVGDSNQTGSNGSNYINDVANGGKPFKAAKFFDRFTGCLPTPQKGPSVTFPLINGSNAPVFAGTNVHTNYTKYPIAFEDGYDNNIYAIGNVNSNIVPFTSSVLDSDGKVNPTGTGSSFDPINLWADLSNSVGAVTVNELRLAFQLQRYYEAIARSGSRYIELVKGLWGVDSDDARMQRPEYLGGKRIPIQIHEVVNQAQAANDFLGDLGAMSHTADSDFLFEYSTREHCFIIITCVLRYDHSYAQGKEAFWSRLDRESYYIPQFASLGEMPVYQDELCATTANMASETVFGYQEAWSDIRYGPQPKITGEMRPGISNTLASWHLSDYYTTAPTLSDSWIREDPNIVDRVLAVGHSVSNQFFADFFFESTVSAVIPMYSVPGLIDHY